MYLFGVEVVVFAESYLSAFEKLLKSKLASCSGTAWYADQVVISPVLVRERIKWLLKREST